MKKSISSAVVLTIAILFVAASQPALAQSVNINFENPPYVTGNIHLQDGWSSSGAATGSCALYDHAVVNGVTTTGFGSQSLRISNAVTSGCFGDQTFSKSLPNEAGETTATNGGMSGGIRKNYYEAKWDFASTVPGAEQPGLSVVASPDRGDGARMSWIQMADTPAGLQVNFFNYKDNFPFGSVGSAANMEAGCAVEDNFFFTTVASGLDRTKVHSIRVVMNLFDGPRNDVVRVYVDGILRHVDTSWEGYFRWCEATGVSRTVDSVLFRTGGVAVPATTGKGFLIDNFGETTTNSYSCVGFEPPMDKDIIAKKKGNKVLPLKMVCKDAYGIVVGPALISPPVVQVTKVGLGDATDPVDVFLSAGQGSEGNEFEFDPLTGKWQFNLQTKNFTGVGVYDITAVPGGADVIVSAPTATFVIQ